MDSWKYSSEGSATGSLLTIKEATMDSARVTDLYEAAYLLLSGCELVEVSCVPVSDSLSCALLFAGSGLPKAQAEFRGKSACVNLHAFRSAYSEVNGYVHQAKKAFDRERRLGRRAERGS